MSYKEPELTIIVLDFLKEEATRLCLESIKRHVKFPVKVIYYHNGNGAEYPYKFFKEGLCDMLIQTQKNEGLGVGTRDTFNAVFSPWTLSLQNDQFIGRDFTQAEFDAIKLHIANLMARGSVVSVSLAGAVCGKYIYSERAHLIRTEDYKMMERNIPLGYNGAGPYHNGEWREAQIQNFYKQNCFIHYTDWPQLVIDNGRTAERENPDGSRWRHFPDTKALFLVSGPVKEKNIYPYLTDAEWEEVLATQKWEDGRIPEREKAHSFHVWN